MKMTVNEAMVLQKALRGRLGELSSLRTTCASKESYYGDNNKVVEPMYDVKALDKKCVELENALLDMDTKIKQSNAITSIEIDADKSTLLSPLT
jgi:hypothetical protein